MPRRSAAHKACVRPDQHSARPIGGGTSPCRNNFTKWAPTIHARGVIQLSKARCSIVSSLITSDLVALGLEPADKDEVISTLAQRLAASHRITDIDKFVADVQAREALTATGMPGQVGLPHAKSGTVLEPSLAAATIPTGVDFHGPDGASTLVILIAAPASGADIHLKILAKLARKLVNHEFTASLRAAGTEQEFADIINDTLA